MTDEQLQPYDTLDDRGVDDVLDEGFSPPEREPDHLKHPEGGEDLATRLDEEEPEVWAEDEAARDRDPSSDPSQDIVDGDVGGEVGDARTGRLGAQTDVGPDGEIQQDSFAEDEGIDGAGASAEEAAMHTIED